MVDAIKQDDIMESITIVRQGSAKDFDANKVFNDGIAEKKRRRKKKNRTKESYGKIDPRSYSYRKWISLQGN